MKALFFIMLLTTAGNALGRDGGFLFITFKGEQTPMTEQIYFAVSDDGKKWDALNGGQPMLVSNVGEKGVRDPFLLRSHDGKKFYLLATDLSINLNNSWSRAVRAGSKSLVIWSSTDLVQWSKPQLVRVAADDAGCAWAPEAIYDEDEKNYLVFWASKNGRDHFAKHRIWASRTKDFITFSRPLVYIDKPNDVIDTDIVRENGKYFRFSKDEKLKGITMEVSTKLTGTWQDVPNFSLANLKGFEGPECYILEPAAAGKPASWCLILDHFAKGDGYQPFVTDNLSSGQFTPGAGFSFPFEFRHGSVLPVTSDELSRLRAIQNGTDPK